jgi:hypothetical protein
MNLERIGQLIERFTPGGLAELERREADAVLEKRKEAAARFAETDGPLATALDVIAPQIERANADVTKKAEALRLSEEKRAGLIRERHNIAAQRSAARLAFERTMRETAPKELIASFLARTEDLLHKAVPANTVIRVYSGNHEPRHIPVSGSADARKRGLFALRQALNNTWAHLPLTDAEFTTMFEAAIAALPALTPPPTAEEFIARTNPTAA